MQVMPAVGLIKEQSWNREVDVRSSKSKFGFGLVLIAIMAGCSHPLQIINPHEYDAFYYTRTPYLVNEVAIGVSPASSDQEEVFIGYICDSLNGIGNVSIQYPYVKSPEHPVDYVLDLDVSVTYGGAGSNFYVSFPGFIVFAPAWHGYNYSADIITEVSITDYKTGMVISQASLQTLYKCVQAEFDRTWIEIGWLPFTFGAIPLLGGLVFMEYDPDITDSFNYELSAPYGEWISTRIGAILESL
jgi:hypothetical protein